MSGRGHLLGWLDDRAITAAPSKCCACMNRAVVVIRVDGAPDTWYPGGSYTTACAEHAMEVFERSFHFVTRGENRRIPEFEEAS